MSKKQNNTDEITATIKIVKSVMLDSIIREWLNTPVKEWGRKTPLQLIKNGEGQKIIDSLKQTELELKKERETLL